MHFSQLEDYTVGTMKQQKLLLLSEVPCGDAFPTCKFIKDAHEAKISIIADENNLARVKTECVELGKVADSYGIDKKIGNLINHLLKSVLKEFSESFF